MKKILCVVVAATLISATQQAQAQVQVGLRAGLNIAKMVLGSDGSLSVTPDRKVGFHAGLIVDIPIVKLGPGSLTLQPGLLLSTRGMSMSASTSAFGSSYKVETSEMLYYLEIPVMATYKFPISKDFAIRANLGIPVGIGLFSSTSAKQNGETPEGYESHNLFKGEDGAEAEYKRLDLAFGMGAGIDFWHFYFGLGYNIGLMNIANIPDDVEGASDASIKNRAFTLSLGYNF